MKTSPDWTPTEQQIRNANISQLMQALKIEDYANFHRWSCEHFQDFWSLMLQKLSIRLDTPYSTLCELSKGIESPQWLSGAKLNIVNSCFNANPQATAIIASKPDNTLQKLTYDELNKLSNRVANSLENKGFKAGDAIGIAMPMTLESVAIYLGIVKAGCIVVGIADSFAAPEITTRLKIANAKAIFTQDIILRGTKTLPLYERVAQTHCPAIVLPAKEYLTLKLKNNDVSWNDFLVTNANYKVVTCEPENTMNILFSSGTTGDPKAIPWTHTTPIKSAADAYLHQNIKPGDILAWPTNLGWMMGPWLIYAALINQASIALYHDLPTDKGFSAFVENAKVTMLGVVPTLVKALRNSKVPEAFDWSSVQVFSSTGECSNAEDMRYLMALAGNKPVIEYCGGTEIGGAYITSTVIQANYASLCSTPALGLDFILIDEEGHETNKGEVALIPPSIGLSNRLLNRNHFEVYYEGMPKTSTGKLLRRHGDHIERLKNGYYLTLGRVDDTMNLGGIKTSSADIERVLREFSLIEDVAAIAITPNGGGASLLVIYVVTREKVSDKLKLKHDLQHLLKTNLNPLFKIYDIVLVETLPRTASNKVMRRVLREGYKA